MSNWSVLVHHAAAHHYRPAHGRRTCATREEPTPMLPMNATPLNERLIAVLIEEHQAEIRRCFAPRPEHGRAFSVRQFLHLLAFRRPATQLSPSRGRAQERA